MIFFFFFYPIKMGIELNYDKNKKFYCFYSMGKEAVGIELKIELSITMIPIVQHVQSVLDCSTTVEAGFSILISLTFILFILFSCLTKSSRSSK